MSKPAGKVLKLSDYRLGGPYTVETLPVTLGAGEAPAPPTAPRRPAGLEGLEADLRGLPDRRGDAPARSPRDPDPASPPAAAVADEILAAARQAAADIVGRAAEQGRRQAEELRAEMLLGAEREIAAEVARRREAAASEAAAVQAQAQAQRQLILASTQHEVMALALAIARRVVAQELRISADVVLSVTREALSHLPDGATEVEVSVNPSDLEVVRQGQAWLREAAGGLPDFGLRPDPSISPGGCRVRTNAGDLDARVETRLAEVAATVGAGPVVP